MKEETNKSEAPTIERVMEKGKQDMEKTNASKQVLFIQTNFFNSCEVKHSKLATKVRYLFTQCLKSEQKKVQISDKFGF